MRPTIFNKTLSKHGEKAFDFLFRAFRSSRGAEESHRGLEYMCACVFVCRKVYFSLCVCVCVCVCVCAELCVVPSCEGLGESQ